MRRTENIIIEKLSDSTIGEAKKLIREYLDWIQVDLCFQHVDEELERFPDKYREPDGVFLIAKVGETVAGCVGLKKIGDRTCEMKRLFVRDKYKGQGVGKDLVDAIILEAKRKGYSRMRLDTLKRMDKALALYRKFGFKEIGQYVENPIEDAVFMEKELDQA
ncbi:MAG: GNAT family N-acetyltransferase [Spirochaetia bacterium]|jgi:ribosomal protein S18 acetylase RimI-like enzyme|nr:GNAT family N-acetyltransferase [Spirochaetia bacterium]